MVLGILPQSGFHTSLHPFASRPRRWPPFTQRLHTVASTVKSLAHRIDVIDAYTLLRIPSTVREVRA